MSPSEITALNEQIAAMAAAGLPLDRGLDLLAAEMPRGKLRTTSKQLAADLRKGVPLDQALQSQSKSLPSYYPPLVAAGIRSGRLPQVLTLISFHTRFVHELQASIVTALIYPLIVLIAAFFIFGLCTFYVLPEFKTIFDEFGMKLPWITEFVLSVAEYPLIFVAGVLGLFLVVVGLLVASRYSPAGRSTISYVVYRLPVIGTAVYASRMYTFTMLMALLTEYEIPLPETFRLAGRACPDPFMAKQAEAVAADLETGMALSRALAGRGLVPEWMSWMGQVGESMTLSAALREVAGVYRKQVENRAAMFRGIFPSFIILKVAGLIGGAYIFALLAPMFKLLEGLSR